MYNLARTKKIEKPFIFIWGLYSMAYVLSATSMLPERYPFIITLYSIITNFIIIVLLFLFLYVRKYSIRKLIFYFLFVLLLLLIEIFAENRNLLIGVLFMLIAPNSNIDFNKLILFDMKLKSTLLLLIIFLCKCGVIENVEANVNGVYKQSLGFKNPNQFTCVAFIILLEWLFLHYGRMKRYQYLVIFFWGSIAGNISNGRSSTYSFWIVLILFFLADAFPQIYYAKAVKIIYGLITPILAILSFVTAYLYMQGNVYMITLNYIMSKRISYNAYALSKYGIKIIGGISRRKGFGSSDTSLLLDNAYVGSAVRFGMLYLIFICIAYSLLFIKLLKYKQISISLLGLFFVLSGIGEGYMLNIAFNTTMLYLLYTDKNMKNICHKYEISS